MPADIREWVIERCYDCHSNQTRWPWYSALAPLSWWIADDVRRGRAGLNFSRWKDYTPRQRALGWRRSLQRIRENRMPPLQYSVLHPGAISELQLNRLETFLKEQEVDAADCLSPSELLAWPATPLSHTSQTLRGAFRVSGTLSQPLHLDNALLLGQGDLNLHGGIRGNGAILATGKLSIQGLTGQIGPLALVGLQGISLEGSTDCRLEALVHTPENLEVRGLQLERKQYFLMPVVGVNQSRVEFCRDDGQLGERIERQVLIRYGHDTYVIWDSEFQLVKTAITLEQALDAVETILKADPVTSTTRWRRRFRSSWKKRLKRLAIPGTPAIFELRADQAGFNEP